MKPNYIKPDTNYVVDSSSVIPGAESVQTPCEYPRSEEERNPEENPGMSETKHGEGAEGDTGY